MKEPLPVKPYIMRALYDWCVDNGFTPQLLVEVDRYTRVPREYVVDDKITLNIAPHAVHQLVIANDLVQFSARFNGVSQEILIPMARVASIFARENGHGMAFEIEEPLQATEVVDVLNSSPLIASVEPVAKPDKSKSRANLQLVK